MGLRSMDQEGWYVIQILVECCLYLGGRHHLKMHLKTSERANEEFPLEPYIQTPDKGFMTSGIEAGTLVIPVNPKQVGIPWLRGK